MAIPGLFKQNKPRGFNYIPRYYDPVREELEQQIRMREMERAAKEGLPVKEERGAAGEGAATKRDAAGESAAGGVGTATKSGTVPYRSTIMRGDMKNYFHRRREKVHKQTTLRLILILLIIVFIIYLYYRFRLS